MNEKFSKYCVVKHNSKDIFPDGTIVYYDAVYNNYMYRVKSIDGTNKSELLPDYDLHFFNTKRNFVNQERFLKIILWNYRIIF